MSWHDQTPWRAKRKAEITTTAERLADVERKCRAGDLGLHEALIAAHAIGIESGRANPAVTRIGETHSPEVQT
jgi:hypothetical protein